MSYTHCPTCQRAFNFSVQAACPFCPVAATAVDASEDIVAAAEQLARAMARATPAERASALARIDHEALAALSPPVVAQPVPAPPPLLARLARAVVVRIDSHPRLRRAADRLRQRVRALAA